jgi:hypothetical protein
VNEWTIRPSEASDVPQLVHLFQRAFGRPISEAHWRWKLQHLDSPAANDWVAANPNGPIFHSGGIPTRYRLPAGSALGMVSVDTMTAPEYRRRGLLTQVGQRMYSTWRESGIDFVIGLINDQWGSRAPALGWQQLFPLRWLIRPLRPLAVLARRARTTVLSRLTPLEAAWNWTWERRLAIDASIVVRDLDRAGAEVDELWHGGAPRTGVSIVRDSAWLNWRYLTCPSFDYRVLFAERRNVPAGYAAYRLDGHVGYIAEIFAPDTTVFETLIGATLERLRATGAEVVGAQAPPGTWYTQALQRAGFLWSWGDFSVQLVPLNPSLRLDILREQGNWTMWGGDYDSI